MIWNKHLFIKYEKIFSIIYFLFKIKINKLKIKNKLVPYKKWNFDNYFFLISSFSNISLRFFSIFIIIYLKHALSLSFFKKTRDSKTIRKYSTIKLHLIIFGLIGGLIILSIDIIIYYLFSSSFKFIISWYFLFINYVFISSQNF